jgi:hypothetical protein
LVEEFPAIQSPVNVVVVEIQKFLVEIRGSFSFHEPMVNAPATQGKVANIR